jgi:hypothetical protein
MKSVYVCGRQAPDFNPFKTQENEKVLKGKVSSLLRQQRLLRRNQTKEQR